MKNTFFTLVLAASVCGTGTAFGQDEERNGPDAGTLAGSFETNSIWYVPDRTATTEQDRWGSNNYLKLDYTRGRFSAGAQAELYGPVLNGFNPALTGNKLTGKFAGWTDGGFAVTIGDFYEQWGAGLVLRSWEDRALGFNNSLEGVRAAYSTGNVTVKAIWARPRMFMDYADTWARGADISLSLSGLTGIDEMGYNLAAEGSYLNRFMGGYSGGGAAATAAGVSPAMNLWSCRLIFDAPVGLSVKAEYVGKGDDLHMGSAGRWEAKKGSAQLVEIGFSRRGLGIFVTGRRLDHMSVRIDPTDGSEANTLNYLPALTRQYTYSLATLEPYTTSIDGEQGGQIDVFYTFARGSALGGKYGTKLHANVSTFYPLERTGRRLNPMYRDVSFDVEKQWNREWKTTLLWAVQTFSPSKGATATTKVNNVFVADVLWKFTPRRSVRLEAQYLYSKENSDWWAATAEVNFAPRWGFFVADMVNHDEAVHYYSGGVSVTMASTRLAVSYGRNRAGYICSGGVCRYMPAYTGANISLTTSF